VTVFMKTLTISDPAEFVAVDLDRTLAEFTWDPKTYMPGKIGNPLLTRCAQVRSWIDRGVPVKIFTARIASNNPRIKDGPVRVAIDQWCIRVFGRMLPVVSEKEYGCRLLVDDIALPVEGNKDIPFPVTIKMM
jgi:hypothetical protein